MARLRVISGDEAGRIWGIEMIRSQFILDLHDELIVDDPRNGGGVQRWASPEKKVVRATGEKDAEAQFRE